VVDSATNWTAGTLLFIFVGCHPKYWAGFSLATGHVYNPTLSVILYENVGLKSLPEKRHANEISQLNDTLDDAMCPKAGSSDPQTDAWTAIYGAPIAERLNTQAPGANLVAADISNLIPLCAFESAAENTTSPFCALFTPDEFAQYEY
jgi:hypothetical protein